MQLVALFESKGSTVEQVAAACSIRPLLLRRIDVGIQPMPHFLAAQVATVIAVDKFDVLSACPLTTRLTDVELLNPLPARVGEKIPFM